MKKMRQLQGIIPVLTTTILENGDIDVAAQKRLVEFLVSKRIGGLWVLGTGSEDMNLPFKKRVEAARVVSEANAGRVPIILGAGFFALEEILEFINETHTLNVDAFHVMPYHPLLSLDRLDWFFRHIADNCPKPLWMYTSANWSRAVSWEFVAGLRDHANIAGIKYSTSNAIDVAKVVKLAQDDFQVITAIATQLYSCLCLGSKGHTSSLGSALPEAMIQIYDYFQSGDYDAALKEQRRLIDFLDSILGGARKDNFLMAAEEKYILSLRGICQEYTTSYYRTLAESEKNKVRKALMSYKMVPSLQL